jgi:hypothetical protein
MKYSTKVFASLKTTITVGLLAVATACSPTLQSQMLESETSEKNQNVIVTTTTVPPTTTTTQPDLTPPNGCPTPVPGFTPAGTIRINSSELYTNNSELSLSLSKNEGFLMKISNNSNCACGEWENYSTTKTWNIHTANASNAISVQYRDFEGVSHCASATITHDTLAPDIALELDPSSEFDTPSLVRLNYSIDDSGSGYANHECRLNGQSVNCLRDPATKSGSLTYNNQIKGDYIFTLTARDQLGQAATRELRWTIIRDETPPAISLEFDSSSDFDVPSNVKLNYSVIETDSGVASHQCTLNGSAVACPLTTQAPYQGSISFPNQVKGDYVFIITVSDQIGNLASKDIRWTVTKDETPPQIALAIDPSSKFEAPSRVKLNYSIDDAHSGYGSHSCKLNNVTVVCARNTATKSGSVTCNNQAKGDYIFILTAVDQLGNSASREVRWTITRDEVDPVINLQLDSSSNFEVPSLVRVNYFIDDIHSGVQEHHCKLNGALTPCDRDPILKTGNVTFSNQTQGDYVFEVTAMDFLGNTASQEINWTIRQSDIVPPTISLVFDPTSKFDTPSRLKLDYSIVDTDSGYKDHNCTLNGTITNCPRNPQNGTGNVIFNNQAIGDYVFVITARDNKNNTSTKQLFWNIRQSTRPIAQNYELSSNNKVDILMIIDNSQSMAFEQRNMAQRMSTFMTQISSLDYKIAITTTDPRSSKDWGDGKFLKMVGLNNQYVITPATPLQQAQQVIGKTLQRKESGDSKEQAIFATYRAIEKSVATATSPNKGFVRPDAAFAGIVISDEDESANSTKNQPQNLLNYVKSLWANKLFVWHSIITKPNDTACKSSEGYSYGVRYDQFSRLTGAGTIGGAIIGSVCAQDYGTQLRGIGDSIQAMQRVIVLECSPLGNPNSSVAVTRNGQNYNEAYEVQGTRLVFERPLQVGQYRLNYECL